MKPRDPLYFFVLGQSYLGLGMVEPAKTAFRECISLDPPDHMVAEISRLIDKATRASQAPNR